jgi:hypothetical protein
MSTFFELDYDRLVRLLLPVRLRRTVMVAWLQCLVAPLRHIYQLFTAHRSANLYTLGHNSQVVYLTAALNDTFDSALRRIYLTERLPTDPLYLYRRAENNPLWIGRNVEAGSTTYPIPQWLYNRTEVATSSMNFLIMAPAGLVYDLDRLRALTDKYRLPSKGNYGVLAY